VIRHVAKGAALVSCALVVSASSCKDSEVRTYIRTDLGHYLDSLAHELCRVREAAAPTAGVGFCDSQAGGDGYAKPPANGNP
jgi:hypothetical protein